VGARSDTDEDEGRALVGLAEQLRDGGVPVERLAMAYPTLHPVIRAHSYLWRDDGAGIAEADIPHGMELTFHYRDSPVQQIYEHRRTQRYALAPDRAQSYPILEELAAEGYVDYFAMPLDFSTGAVGSIAWCTRQAGGFTREHAETLASLCFAVALVTEVHAGRRTISALLDTFLGHGTGERVISGQIRRGDGETIHAVLWFCDMRGFTALSNTTPRDELITLLNDFFEAAAEPITALGGEVLKFVGDAMLAIFRVGPEADDAEICEIALTAAEVAEQGIKRLNRQRRADGKEPIRFGLALHIGDVMYGNVGTPTRLDFTVTGPAVNLAQRLEKLAGALDRTVITSSAFAAHCPRPLVSLGTHQVKGLEQSIEAFGL
jgi:adenylate cyclase